MKQFTSKVFLTGIISALVVVIANYIESVYINHLPMDNNAFVIALAIAIVGYLGNFLTGIGNTQAGIIGAALLALIPLISTGHIDWKMVLATLALKLLGLVSDGVASENKKI